MDDAKVKAASLKDDAKAAVANAKRELKDPSSSGGGGDVLDT